MDDRSKYTQALFSIFSFRSCEIISFAFPSVSLGCTENLMTKSKVVIDDVKSCSGIYAHSDLEVSQGYRYLKAGGRLVVSSRPIALISVLKLPTKPLNSSNCRHLLRRLP